MMNAKFIFISENLFKSLFCKYNDDSSPKELSSPDSSHYKHFAHCHKINTEGMLEQIVMESGQWLYSTMVSHWTVPVDFVETTTISVHLVSIKNVENVTNIPSGTHMAMCSA